MTSKVKNCYNCEHWQQLNSQSGNCLKSKIIPSTERLSLLGIKSFSGYLPAGQIITDKNYYCGCFEDDKI